MKFPKFSQADLYIIYLGIGTLLLFGTIITLTLAAIRWIVAAF